MSKENVFARDLYFNGINGATGGYGLEPMSDQEFANLIVKQKKPRKDLVSYRPRYGIDEKNLAETGWGILLPHDNSDPAKMARNKAVKEALSELLEHRKNQAGEYFKVFEGPKKVGGGYRPGETKIKFLARQGVGSGTVDPSKGVPYYLLIVGSPEEIPYRFQNELDVQYAVGRIDFGDDLYAYAHYARGVVTAETSRDLKLSRKVSFFGAENPDDKATELSAEHLVRPLCEKLSQERTDWTIESFIGKHATKAQLAHLLGGDQMPAVLFTASHGMEFPKNDPRQIPHQGALLCQDWPGPREWREAIPQDFYFAGDDLANDANLLGLLTFYFACYGAGTPLLDEFAKQAFKDREPIAPYPFVAGLPTKMLSHPKGGALAVIGHVERAWGYSFLSPGAGAQITVFEDTIRKLLDGYPIGSAIETTNERYAEIATELTTAMEEYKYDPDHISPQDLAGLWIAHNDARGYIIVGDPAVRLPEVTAKEKDQSRPSVILTADRQDELAQLEKQLKASDSPGHAAPAPPLEPSTDIPADTESFAVAFGLRDQFDDLTASVKKFTDQLATALKDAAADLATLEIKTYTTSDLDTLAESKLRARTFIAFDGDIEIYVPERASGIDEKIRRIHLEMVREAQANRAQFLSAMAEMATNLLKSLK